MVGFDSLVNLYHLYLYIYTHIYIYRQNQSGLCSEGNLQSSLAGFFRCFHFFGDSTMTLLFQIFMFKVHELRY